jgi:hypothetical protein
MRSAFTEIFNIKETSLLLPLIKSLAEVFPLLVPEDLSENKAFTTKTFKRVVEIWNESKTLPWKFLTELIRVIPNIQRFFKEHKFFEYFLEELSSIIKSGNFQLKREASYAFCKLLRQNESYRKREKYLIDMLGLKTSVSYYERVGFLEFCKALVDCYSLAFIRNHDVVAKVLALVNDKVSSMRLRIIKASIELTTKLQEDLQRVVERKLVEMCNDSNKDVKFEAQEAVTKINIIINDTHLQLEIAKKDLIKEQEENLLLEKVDV